MRYPRYPAYKDSGVEWLGNVPEHWQNWKISHAFKTISSGTTPSTNRSRYYNGTIPWVNTSELRDNLIRDTTKKLTNQALRDHSSLHIYPKGTLLVALYGATIGKVGILGIPATTNQACCALADSEYLFPKFVFYWLIAHREPLISLSYGGGQPNISQGIIRSLRIPAPQIVEQRAIAAFLDRETAKIDALVRKQERLIELLEEKRVALISHTVTKGLDPDAEMKETGIEWLGEIPARWNAMSLKYACSQSAIYGANVSASEYTDEGVRFVRTTDINDRGELLSDDPVYLERGIVKDYLLEDGDLLLSRSGTVGRAFIYDGQTSEECAYAGYLVGFKIKKTVLLPKIAFYFTKSKQFEEWISLSVISSTIGNVNGQKYANMPLPVPPLSEQHDILAYLDRETTKIDALIDKAEAMIERLQEYRTALISAAVTGKIDVREEVPAT